MKANPQNLQTASKEVLFLGIKVTPSSWRLNEKFTKVVQYTKAPTNINDLEVSRVGELAIFFLPNFNDSASPLYILLKKQKRELGVQSSWTGEQLSV